MNPKAKKSVVFAVVLLFAVGCIAQVQISITSEEAPADWVAHPLYISPFAGSLNPQGYSPSQMRTAYNLPSSGGNGTIIAIIDAYDTPNILTYFNTFSNQFGLPDNSTGNFLVYKMSPNMQTDSGWALETCLDVEWAHAIAPNATILLVEAVNPSNYALLSAVDYATSYPGVVAVSMSWGGDEFSGENGPLYENHFNKPGIAFFASSGDDGSSVLWPAASANVVSVGGTSLYLNPDGTVISEVAWTNSSGGVSSYEPTPAYQTSLGLNYTGRAVPDVSYDANASTGVSVYNGTWWRMGGTSAGAPQWAAIHALGLSATNTNLYNRAKSAAYPQYLRDITTGANFVNNATPGYDLVTGLGSPLTANFGTEVTITPSEGPPNGSVTLNGTGFALSNSVNITYLNPINTSWVPLINNLTITSDNFSYAFNAPDLLQNSTAGDKPAQSDSIVFRVVDSNNHVYNATLPYTEWRRGLAQVGTATAQGLFGNNTDLTMSLFVQSGDSVPIVGKWFSPGNVSVLWDNDSLGTFSVDSNGFFNANVQVPTATTGQHTLTINDGGSTFCLNLTRLPTVANNYTNTWRTSNFTINLTPDSPVNETFYSINGGAVQNVTANGQPIITTEGSNNTLEYWSTWNLYGTGSTVEVPPVLVTGIKLNETPPVGSITANPNTDTPTITLTLSATDAVSGVSQMRFSNDGVTWSSWEKYATSKSWTLQGGDGQKTVSVQFMDNAGLTSPLYSATVTLTTPTPTPPAATPAPAISNSTPSPTPTPTPSPSPTPTQTATPTKRGSIDNSSPTISLTLQVIIVLIAALAVCCVVWLIRKRK